MPLEYEAIVTISVAKQIAESIRSAILEGRLKADDRLPTEDELAQRYGVSRPTIREALKRLAAQNLIRSRRGPTGGNFVSRPNPEDLAESLAGAATLMVSLGAYEIDEISEARLQLETVCCRLAAANRTEQDVAALRAELEMQSDGAISDEQFCASDVRFHRALVNATANGPLRFVMHAVVEAIMPVTNMVVFRVRERRAIVRFHERLLAGIEAGDAEAAVDALRELMAYLRDRYAEARERRAAAERPQRAPTRAEDHGRGRGRTASRS